MSVKTLPALKLVPPSAQPITETLTPIYMRLFALESSLKCAVNSAIATGDESTASAFEAIRLMDALLAKEAEKIERFCNSKPH